MLANVLGYDEAAEFLANLDPQRLATWRPSDAVQARVETLIYKKKDDQLSVEEVYELDRYMALEQLIALTKARARKRLAA